MVSMLSTFKEKQSQNAALALTNINLSGNHLLCETGKLFLLERNHSLLQ